MRVLIVKSGNADYISPFILDQVIALKKKDVEIEYFLIKGKGILGYLKNYKNYKKKIRKFKPKIIHAHYGLSGLFANLQRIVPVVVTFHGCDINVPKQRLLSNIASKLSSKSIFVSDNLAKKLHIKNPIVIPCGVDMDIFYPKNKAILRSRLGLSNNKKYILFSSSFSNYVKNYPLAQEAISKISNIDIELIELKGFNRIEVSSLMNAVDAALLTSIREGSPQFIKEALACNCPIISTDVGDVKSTIKNIQGCFIAKNDSQDIAIKIQEALKYEKSFGRDEIKHLDNNLVADKIINVYKSIIKGIK